MDASWIGLIGVVVGVAATTVTTLISENFSRRNARDRDEAERELVRRDEMRKVILRLEKAINAIGLDTQHNAKYREAFDELDECQIEFGLLVKPAESVAADAVSWAVKGARRATTDDQIVWISAAISGHLPRWYRGEITNEEFDSLVRSATSTVPGTPTAQGTNRSTVV